MTSKIPMSSDPLKDSLSGQDLPQYTESMDLVQRLQKGEGKALDKLLERYQDRIRRIVRIKLGSRLREHVESMDIVQQVNIVAIRKLETLELRDNASILRWLSQIALNQIRDVNQYFTAERRDVNRVIAMDFGPRSDDDGRPRFQGAGDDPLPEEQAWRNELREILDDSMTKLSEEYREIIMRRDYYGEDWATIANELGYSAKQKSVEDLAERLERAVHAAQEFHRRAWIKLRRIVRPRLDGLI